LAQTFFMFISSVILHFSPFVTFPIFESLLEFLDSQVFPYLQHLFYPDIA
jgi:hypothetical protein